MPQFCVVSRELHAGKKWRRFDGYSFAPKEALAPIVVAELASATLCLPLGFSEQAGRYALVAVLSPTPGRNMFVGPDGRWLAPYIPACFRGYPFRLLPKQGTDEVVLCVDADSNLISEGGSEGEDFFDQDGNISPALKAVFDFLLAIEQSRSATDLAVSALAETAVIQPWSIKLKTPQGEQAIGGLHRIDEAALGALTNEAFLKLRQAGALPIAYMQPLSRTQLQMFESLEKLQAQLAPRSVPANLPESLDRLFELPSDDIIRFH